jgi:hypothetical protein
MVYDLTDKLRFDEDPVLVVRNTRLTVRSDAENVLRLMDALREKGEADGVREAAELLLSPADRKKLGALGLKMDDYLAVMRAAVRLALGADPEDEAPGE